MLEKVDAQGDVKITTPTEFVSSETGVYHVNRELAELAGGVKITRGDAQLNGEYAEVNLATGVSRLLSSRPGGGDDDGRVHGLLVPATEDAGDDDS